MPIWLYMAIFVGLYAIIGVGAFLLAGTMRLPFIWAVLGSQAVMITVGFKFIDPDLLDERFHVRGKDLDPWGRLLVTILYLVQIGTAALDVGRFHITDNVPLPVKLAAFVIQMLGWIAFTWAMHENRFFSEAIRLQNDRGHTVVSTGPYHWIRHPGYSFGAIAFITQGLAMGSWLSVIPGLLTLLAMLRRTFMEEKLLSENLPGYEEYQRAVRYRWLPGIW